MMRFIISLLLMLHVLGAHAEEGDLLEPEQAFKFSARVLDGNNIEVRYQIANGYYLYREKFKFSVDAGWRDLRHRPVPGRQNQAGRIFRQGGNLPPEYRHQAARSRAAATRRKASP